MRLSRKSQLAKFGSISTFRSVNWSRNEAWPIQVMATWPWVSLGKTGRWCLAGAPGQQRLPDHLAEERARVKMLGRGKILERARQRLAAERRTIRGVFRHNSLSILSIRRFE